MVALITMFSSAGVIGRCDAKCYDARTPECDCICGGANHGKGLSVGRSQTDEHFAQWVVDYLEKLRVSRDDVETCIGETKPDRFPIKRLTKREKLRRLQGQLFEGGVS